MYHEGLKRLRYINCGHLAPILIPRQRRHRAPRATTTVLGLFAGMALTEASIDLNPGDTLLLFSDGITEAANPAGDEFGEDCLPAFMRGALPSIPTRILDAVRTFSPGTPSDDRTALCLRRRDSPRGSTPSLCVACPSWSGREPNRYDRAWPKCQNTKPKVNRPS